ncbi:hypothetical protein DASC09_016410 [Saccharomycopsis crataegensis]|uniref:Uncharacterized protein n=1 Tax=Saccharomycopsis crataegensis TaxID=43959 RepID=A0AAV5QI19_9ASCO|nr:hypothetical protein DASC09_016410 [Saccharomycopsis crataegensis]
MSSSLSTTIIVYIAIGGGVALALVVSVAYYIVRKVVERTEEKNAMSMKTEDYFPSRSLSTRVPMANMSAINKGSIIPAKAASIKENPFAEDSVEYLEKPGVAVYAESRSSYSSSDESFSNTPAGSNRGSIYIESPVESNRGSFNHQKI